MQRIPAAVAALLVTTASVLPAQSSIFGVRGIGHPGRAASTRTIALGGSIGAFDGLSSQNPASLVLLGVVTSSLNASTSWRSSSTPEGDASLRGTRFPQLLIGGPVARTPLAVSFSYSSYADRDFTIVSSGTASPRGEPVAFTDTLSSRGGVSDLRLAAAWRINPRLAIGAGMHFLTGSNRLTTRRVFADSAYIAAQQRAELGYEGYGLSAGVLFNPVAGLALAGAIRQDGSLDIERDSTATTGSLDLPVTLIGAARLRLRPTLEIMGQVTSRSWGTADEDLRDNGAIGAKNTLEVAGGAEFITNARRAGHRPIRLGVRYTKLPFLITPSAQPSEWAVSAGTALRFRPSTDSRDMGGIDLAIERVQRRQGSDFRESAWLLTIGVSIFTGGATP